jgi:hypothetical protein
MNAGQIQPLRGPMAEYLLEIDHTLDGVRVGAGGGARARTVVLLSADQLDAAAEKQTTYRPPGNQTQ